MGTVSIAATVVQPKNDIVKFWQTVIGPDYDIVVSSSTVDNFFSFVAIGQFSCRKKL